MKKLNNLRENEEWRKSKLSVHHQRFRDQLIMYNRAIKQDTRHKIFLSTNYNKSKVLVSTFDHLINPASMVQYIRLELWSLLNQALVSKLIL